MQNKTKHEISWIAPEFIEYQKNPKWYVSLLIVGVILLAYAIWQKDILTFITFLALIFAAYVFAHRKPKQVKVNLTGKGIGLNSEEYPYNSLKSFWIIYNPPEVKTLHIETTQYLNKELVIQLQEVDPNDVRALLERYLPENFEKEESYTDKLMRKLKF